MKEDMEMPLQATPFTKHGEEIERLQTRRRYIGEDIEDAVREYVRAGGKRSLKGKRKCSEDIFG